MKQNRTLSALAVFVSAVLWGTYGSFVTVISAGGLGRNILQAFRFGVTALTVCAVMLVKDRSMFRVRREDRILFLLNGFASILFFTTCYTMAIQETKIATAAALLYTAPALVLVLSALLFREKVNGKKVICILLSILGCAFVSGIAGGASGLTVRGLLLGLGAGLGYALYSIFSRFILDRGYTIYTNIFYTFGIAALSYLLWSAADGTLTQPAEHPGAAFLAVLCGLFTGAAAYILYTWGLKGLESSRAAQIATIEPVTAAVLGMLLFHQTLSGSELFGVALVVGSVLLMNL